MTDINKATIDFSSHLFPNNSNYRQRIGLPAVNDIKDAMPKLESPKRKDASQSELTIQRSKQLQDLIASLQGELSEQLNNHKLFLEDIEKIEKEREFYYNILKKMELLCEQTPDNEIKRQIASILRETPDDFKVYN